MQLYLTFLVDGELALAAQAQHLPDAGVLQLSQVSSVLFQGVLTQTLTQMLSHFLEHLTVD